MARDHIQLLVLDKNYLISSQSELEIADLTDLAVADDFRPEQTLKQDREQHLSKCFFSE